MNLQPWKVVVVKKREGKQILRQCAYNQPKVEEASAVFIIIADPLALEENLEKTLQTWVELGYIKDEQKEHYLKASANLYGEPDSLKRKLFAVKNTALFAMNLMTAAKGFDIDTHPMDGFDENCIKEKFAVPEDKTIIMLIAAGYLLPGHKVLPRAYRRQVKDFLKYESYKND
ncbi:nitroreductase [Candidatus Magnetoovum chiemensis]|nr:nitroreductase [Candidatus Magnetoovum chiemensis]